MRIRLLLGVTLVLATWASARAQVPSEAEFEAALALARTSGPGAGLDIRSDGMALQQWRERLPLAARREGQRCQIGYLPWLASQRFAWLFPALADAERRLWLGGLVAHEVAHCRHAGLAAAAGATTAAAQEAVADLAFALHVDQSAESGARLIGRLATLRQAQAQRDPAHDTHATLQCYLAQRERLPASEPRSLDAWQERCVAQLFWPN